MVKKLLQFDELEDGKPQRIEVGEQCLLLCRVSDSVYAVDEMCTHEDISLSLGVLCEHRLRCPLHGSQFDIRTGQVIDEPADTDLQTYNVYVKDGWVWLEQ